MYLLLVGTVAPSSVATTTVTVSILVMVVLGGAGTRWGAVVGAMVYVYLQQYLLKIAAEPSFASLPAPLRVPLSQPGDNCLRQLLVRPGSDCRACSTST